MKGFGHLLDESYKSFKEHFLLFVKITFVLYFLPRTILEIITRFIPNIFLRFGISIYNSLIIWLLHLLIIFTVIKVLLIKKKEKEISFSQALTEGSKHYGEGIILSVIMQLALFGLFLLFVIPAVIYGVYWSFAYYALITDNVGVTKALAHSKKVVEGRWWKVLGINSLFYLMLFALLIPLYFVLNLFFGLVNFVIPHLQFVYDILMIIIDSGIFMFVIPFSLIFMAKFYLDLKKSTKNLD